MYFSNCQRLDIVHFIYVDCLFNVKRRITKQKKYLFTYL